MPNFSLGYHIRPHPLAPILSQASDCSLILSQLTAELASGNFSLANDEVRALIAEAGIVNLWFFGKFIAGFNGPFDKLTEDLHRDMCNFRQSDYCMRPGARAGICMPRKHYKSTVFTVLGTAWELVLDGNLCFRLTNAVVDRAEEFMHTTQRIFDSNEFFAWLYPWATMKKGMEHWNDKEAVVRWRSRHFTEPSIKCGGATAAAAGDHHDVLINDDLIDMSMLNAQRQSGSDIIKARDFMNSSQRTLVRTWTESRIIVPHTRYSMDDCYEPIWSNAKEIIGYNDARFETKPDGEWSIYYRLVEENEKIIFPEAITKEGLAKMAKEDWWTYATQYMNNLFDAGGAELISLKHKLCTMQLNADKKWEIVLPGGDKPNEIIPLDRCDVVVAVDPAALERAVSARTSRSAVVTVARDWKGRTFCLEIRAGFVELAVVYDWIFAAVAKFKGCIRMVAFERVAFQTVLQRLLEAERVRRNLFVNIDGVPHSGDKTARIRSRLGPELQGGRLYIEEHYEREFLNEKNVFPQAQGKDVLDALEMGMSILTTPFSEEEEEFRSTEEERWAAVAGRNSTTGY